MAAPHVPPPRRRRPSGGVEMPDAMKPCSRIRFVRPTKALALALAVAAPSQAAEKLGSFPVDPTQISVAGISSGAFMANQLQIAHSAEVMGAAMIAGGLYGCAVQDVTEDGVLALASQAVGPCLKVPFLLDD